jgi:DNA-binding MarR family transcriptional regulator
VTLYAVEPIACSPDALAHDVEIDLEEMRDVLKFMEKQGWVCREHPATQASSARVHLTEAGVDVTILAVHRFLEITATLTEDLAADQRAAAVKACAQIVRSVAIAQNERSKEEFHP